MAVKHNNPLKWPIRVPQNIQDRIENLGYFGGSFIKGISEDLSQKVKDFRDEKT